MTDKTSHLLHILRERNRRRPGTGIFDSLLLDGSFARTLTLHPLGSLGTAEGPREGASLGRAGIPSTPLADGTAAAPTPTASGPILAGAMPDESARVPHAAPVLAPGASDSAGTSFQQALRFLSDDQALIRTTAPEAAVAPWFESENTGPSFFNGSGAAIHQAAPLSSSAVAPSPLMAGMADPGFGPASQTTVSMTATIVTTAKSSVDISHIATDVSAVVVPGAKTIALSSLFTVAASATDPTYLIVSIVDRDEYGAGATGATGTLSGNGHTATLSAATSDNDARSLGVVFTYDSASGRYYNSTYGYFDAVTYTASGSAGDITDIALYATSNAAIATRYATSNYALTLLDSGGYVSTVTVATESGFTGTVPSQATPSSIAALAESFVGKAWNMDGCWTLACTIAAEAGASLPVASTYVGTAGQAGGEWIVAYDGTVSASSNWESALTAGEFVVFETTSGDGHITFVASGSGSSAKLIDNITYENASGTILNSANDGSSDDVTIAAAHAASQEFAGVSASSVVIYELDTPIISTLVSSDKLALTATQSLSALFAITDPGHKTITEIQVYDTNGGDSLVVNGITVSAHTAATAAEASSLSSISLAAGAAAGTDVIEVRAYNGTYWGDWGSLTVSVTGSTTSTIASSGSGTAATAGISVTATPAQTASDGTAYSLILPSTTFTDSAGLSYTTKAYQTSGVSAVSWLHYDSATMTLSGTVPSGLTGSITVDIVATDTAGHTASDIFSLSFVHGSVSSTVLVGAVTGSTEYLELG